MNNLDNLSNSSLLNELAKNYDNETYVNLIKIQLIKKRNIIMSELSKQELLLRTDIMNDIHTYRNTDMKKNKMEKRSEPMTELDKDDAFMNSKILDRLNSDITIRKQTKLSAPIKHKIALPYTNTASDIFMKL